MLSDSITDAVFYPFFRYVWLKERSIAPEEGIFW